MTDPIKRFSSRVENYAKYRPDYPRAIIDLLESECALTPQSVVADIGSGTGILSEMFLTNGNPVFGVEPNPEMRAAAERLLLKYPNFGSTSGRAEATTLDAQSIDFVTAGQAFHWFDWPKAREEFARVLKPQGWVVLIWNERRLDSSPFLRAYEQLLLKFGTDYPVVSPENVTDDIASFFTPEAFRLKIFENFQEFDCKSLEGRVFSASYTPEPRHPHFGSMVADLRRIFSTYQRDGKVRFEYDTNVYYGHLS
jgi:ubiquinone/menaquinone biosynthesis C-methylase UbiE